MGVIVTTTLACHRQLVYLYVDSSTVKKIRHEKWFHLFIILCQKLLQKFKYHARILIFYVQKWVATDDKRIEAMKTRVDIIQEAQAQPKSNFNSSKKKRKKKKSKPKKSPPVIEIDASSSHNRRSNESRRGNILEKASGQDILQSAHPMREHDSRRSKDSFVPRPVSDILQRERETRRS